MQLGCVIYFSAFPSPMKVPFEEVPELVAGRKVLLQKGHAYVAMNQVHINSCLLVGVLNLQNEQPCFSN